jgi:hypothetical protein
MELKEKGFDVHVVEDHDRHKIWTQYPNAKEITKPMYDDLVRMMQAHNKKVEDNEQPEKDNEQRPSENGHITKNQVRLRQWKSALLGAWLRVQQTVGLPFKSHSN